MVKKREKCIIKWNQACISMQGHFSSYNQLFSLHFSLFHERQNKYADLPTLFFRVCPPYHRIFFALGGFLGTLIEVGHFLPWRLLFVCGQDIFRPWRWFLGVTMKFFFSVKMIVLGEIIFLPWWWLFFYCGEDYFEGAFGSIGGEHRHKGDYRTYMGGK